MDTGLWNRVREDCGKLTGELICRRITVSLVESCTSGLMASLLTDTPGASAVFHGSLVTYSNEEKIKAGVSAEVLRTFGVYSAETAEEMARLAKRYYAADIGIGISGSLCTADPENEDSVPGEVWYSLALPGGVFSGKILVSPDFGRFEAKLSACAEIARKLLDILADLRGMPDNPQKGKE